MVHTHTHIWIPKPKTVAIRVLTAQTLENEEEEKKKSTELFAVLCSPTLIPIQHCLSYGLGFSHTIITSLVPIFIDNFFARVWIFIFDLSSAGKLCSVVIVILYSWHGHYHQFIQVFTLFLILFCGKTMSLWILPFFLAGVRRIFPHFIPIFFFKFLFFHSRDKTCRKTYVKTIQISNSSGFIPIVRCRRCTQLYTFECEMALETKTPAMHKSTRTSVGCFSLLWKEAAKEWRKKYKERNKELRKWKYGTSGASSIFYRFHVFFGSICLVSKMIFPSSTCKNTN